MKKHSRHREVSFRAQPQHRAAGTFLLCAALALGILNSLAAAGLPSVFPQEQEPAGSEQTTLLASGFTGPGRAVLPSGAGALDRILEKQPDRAQSARSLAEAPARLFDPRRPLPARVRPNGFPQETFLPRYLLHRALLI